MGLGTDTSRILYNNPMVRKLDAAPGSWLISFRFKKVEGWASLGDFHPLYVRSLATAVGLLLQEDSGQNQHRLGEAVRKLENDSKYRFDRNGWESRGFGFEDIHRMFVEWQKKEKETGIQGDFEATLYKIGMTCDCDVVDIKLVYGLFNTYRIWPEAPELLGGKDTESDLIFPVDPALYVEKKIPPPEEKKERVVEIPNIIWYGIWIIVALAMVVMFA